MDTQPSGYVSTMSNSTASAMGSDELTLQLWYLKHGVPVGSPESRESSNTGDVLTLVDYIILSNS